MLHIMIQYLCTGLATAHDIIQVSGQVASGSGPTALVEKQNKTAQIITEMQRLYTKNYCKTMGVLNRICFI